MFPRGPPTVSYSGIDHFVGANFLCVDCSPFGLLSGYHPLYLSPIAGTPEVTFPSEQILISKYLRGC